ncbi:DUF1127 domain-containing protein [Rhizobium lentis]|uniref:DUF1127 domain-containing protein n=1 Tax=Rhizobium lentis TaxID=1138194 RepID=A0A9Q3QW51_9HYPH|nr:DUF1127 domain-containing protein [Rhizobium lentis]MBX4956372.1 DUF1127 domain-containing protein [Rhizobium lentis]MBX5010006.1 DUF1127 domain-containing protein [Rhizobium lentis]MBX5023014.1 DUF1127 domain-containing protein [Rhizobium lentis]MBX5028967.1 DUF1127 domain-containing protein [Rhizobium lentis]MBX5034963.1 DUF1127 domain-containing protein [Rhizobium lentis]
MSVETSQRIEASCDAGWRKLCEIMPWGLWLLAAIEHRLEKRRSRRTLSELTDDELRDVGLTRAQANAEASKSWFWS